MTAYSQNDVPIINYVKNKKRPYNNMIYIKIKLPL